MILITTKNQLTVQPDFPCILAAQPQLRRPVGGRYELRLRIAGDLLQRPVRFVEIHHAILVIRGVFLPANLPLESRILRAQPGVLLRAEHLGKPGAPLVVERPHNLPVDQKTKVASQVNLAAKLPQLSRDTLNLIQIPGRIQRLPVKQHRPGLVVRLGQALRLTEQARHRLPPQVHAGVAEQTGHQPLRRLGIRTANQVKCHRPWLGIVTLVQQKLTQFNQRQRTTLGQSIAGDHLDRAPEIIRGKRIGPVHRLEQRGDGLRTALGQAMQRLPRSLITLPFTANRAQRRHRSGKLTIRRLAKRDPAQAKRHRCHQTKRVLHAGKSRQTHPPGQAK